VEGVPAGFETVVGAVGLPAAVRLVDAWGGSSIEVPKEPACTHPVSLRIGYTPAVKLAMLAGGSTLNIPDIGPELKAERERRILADRARGASIGQLSREYEFSHRSVRNLLSRHGLAGVIPT
jgi:hypothetical protein